VAGEYGIPQMISANIHRVIAGITLPLRPVATQYAVLGQRENLVRLYRAGTRLSMMMVVLPIAVLVTHGRLFIIHWTGPEMESAYSVMMLAAGLLFLAMVGIPAEHIITATGRISDVMLTRLAASALGVGGALVVAKLDIGGLHGIVAAIYLPTALRGFIYLPWRVTLEVPVTWGTTVFGCVLPPLLACIVPIFSGWLLLKAWTPESFLGVLFQMGLAALTYAPVVWFILLSADERGIIRRALLPAGLNQRLAKG
jgi:O-antigen/teichoic acid export membrane protein